MDPRLNKAIESLITPSLGSLALQTRNTRTKLLTNLLEQRSVPDNGWDDITILQLLFELSGFDMNNAPGSCGVGEREGRIYSNIVRNRHFGMTHGIGRSGDIMALQPKAPGSSLINILTQYLILDILRTINLKKAAQKALLLPMATGMTLHLCLCYLKSMRSNARYVLWSRIDQKSCFKSITSSGLTPIIIPLLQQGDSLTTHIEALESAIHEYGIDNIVCIMTTTSTFAPRVPDDIPKVAAICHLWNLPHVINNAYGLQCYKCCHIIEEACCSKKEKRRIDFIIQSTDKNFMIPVGGSIIFSPIAKNIDELSKFYAGRASGVPTLDLFITLLQMGRQGYLKLRHDRQENFIIFKQKLETFCNTLPKGILSLLDTPENKISIALKLGNDMDNNINESYEKRIENLSAIGSALFVRRCSGARVICNIGKTTIISNYTFKNFGSHSDTYTSASAYLTIACALGATKNEFDIFLERLEKVLKLVYNDLFKSPLPLIITETTDQKV